MLLYLKQLEVASLSLSLFNEIHRLLIGLCVLGFTPKTPGPQVILSHVNLGYGQSGLGLPLFCRSLIGDIHSYNYRLIFTLTPWKKNPVWLWFPQTEKYVKVRTQFVFFLKHLL